MKIKRIKFKLKFKKDFKLKVYKFFNMFIKKGANVIIVHVVYLLQIFFSDHYPNLRVFVNRMQPAFASPPMVQPSPDSDTTNSNTPTVRKFFPETFLWDTISADW